MTQRLEDVLEGGDGLFEGFFEWLEGQYDAASGGFYYARSSRDSGTSARPSRGTGMLLILLISSRWELSAPGSTNGDRPASRV